MPDFDDPRYKFSRRRSALASVRLPDVTTVFAASARRFVKHSAFLLQEIEAQLLSVTSLPHLPDQRVSVLPWDRHLKPRHDLAWQLSRAETTSALSYLETTASIILTELVRRWPSNALPPSIGIVTDGTGVAFSSEYPSPLCANWLIQHTSSQSLATIIVEFDKSGLWCRLQSGNGSLH